jgi:RNase P subunit RPR2
MADFRRDSAHLLTHYHASLCPTCGRPMWQYSPDRNTESANEEYKFLCVTCDTEFRLTTRNGVNVMVIDSEAH